MICLLKKAIVDLPIRLKGNSKCTSGNSLSLLWAQKKNIGAALQMLLTRVCDMTQASDYLTHNNHRGPTQSLCVTNCNFIVNIQDLQFASSVAINR